MRDEMVLIMSPIHPLAACERLHVRDLGSERLVSLNLRDAFHRRMIEAFKRFDTPLNIAMKVDTFEELKKLVAMNHVVALAPLMCVREEIGRRELVTVPLEGLRYDRTLWLSRRATDAHSFAARAFTRLAEQISVEMHERAGSRTKHNAGVGKPAEVIRIQTRRADS
jgi:LysR family cyn operon transcriptional activator